MMNLEGDIEVKGAIKARLSILCEGQSIKSAFPQVELTIDGNKCPIEISRSVGAFSAGGYTDEDWVWINASTGWRKVQLNHSIKGQTMTMGGKMFHRGIGTHAFSRIVYKRPENHDTFAATIGCDQKALVGSLVFVIEGDGEELFRSLVFRADSTPMNIRVPIGGTDEIALIVEDGGDRINADHGNWANARFLKTNE